MKAKAKVKRITKKTTIGVCKHCGEILMSVYRHDFNQCHCGKSFIDGGEDYIRATTDTMLYNIKMDMNDYNNIVKIRTMAYIVPRKVK